MESIVVSRLMLLAALLLVALNGLFVAAEFAFVKLRSSEVEEMVREGKASAGIVKEAIGNLDGYLAVQPGRLFCEAGAQNERDRGCGEERRAVTSD